MKTIPLLLLLPGLTFGQATPGCPAISPEAAKRQFSVASVKPGEPLKPPFAGNPFIMTGGPGSNDPGRFTVAHTTLSTLIMRAYGLDGDQFKGPSWLSDVMKAGFAISATMPSSTTQEEFCGMLRNLMVERFHLTFHYEKQPRPGYELAVVPGGPKFKEFVPGAAAPSEGTGRDSGGDPFAQIRARGLDANGFPNLPPGEPTAMATKNSPTGATKESFRDNMAVFARHLAAIIDQEHGAAMGAGLPVSRVVDKTGLAGVYDIRIEFAGIPFPNLAAGGAPAPPPDPIDAGPNIFNAVQQQLGLKLTKVADVRVDVMIIDHVDPTPTEN